MLRLVIGRAAGTEHMQSDARACSLDSVRLLHLYDAALDDEQRKTETDKGK